MDNKEIHTNSFEKNFSQINQYSNFLSHFDHKMAKINILLQNILTLFHFNSLTISCDHILKNIFGDWGSARSIN